MKNYVLLLATVFAAACGSSTPESTTPEATASATAAATAAPTATQTAAATAAPTAAPTAAASAAPTASAVASSAPAAGPPDAKNGEKLFTDNKCDTCHGTKAKPGTKAPNVYKMKWDDAGKTKAIGIIKNGKSPMPKFGDKLNDGQIADIMAFIAAAK